MIEDGITATGQNLPDDRCIFRLRGLREEQQGIPGIGDGLAGLPKTGRGAGPAEQVGIPCHAVEEKRLRVPEPPVRHPVVILLQGQHGARYIHSHGIFPLLKS